MAAQVLITLDTLHCLRQSDGGGQGSEPYVWPFLASIALRPFTFVSTPTAPSIAQSKQVIRKELRAGQSVDLDGPFNHIRAVFQEGQIDQQLILIVALLEDDGTSRTAITAGYGAFVKTLGERLLARLAEYLGADAEERAAIVAELKAEVAAKAKAAIKAKLGILTQLFGGRDDFLASDFRHFKNPIFEGKSNFTLHFDAPGDRFTLDGTLNFSQSDVHGPVTGGKVGPVSG